MKKMMAVVLAMAAAVMLTTANPACADNVLEGMLAGGAFGALIGSTYGEVGRGAAIGVVAGALLSGGDSGYREVHETVYYTPAPQPVYAYPVYETVYVQAPPPVYYYTPVYRPHVYCPPVYHHDYHGGYNHGNYHHNGGHNHGGSCRR